MSLSMLKQAVLNDEEEKVVPEAAAPELPLEKPDAPLSGLDLLRRGVMDDAEDVSAAKVQKEIVTNSAVQEAALRFAKDRHGMTDISVEDAMDEFVEHFREFNVNELTAAGDYRYVSAAAADATERGDEVQRVDLATIACYIKHSVKCPAILTASGKPQAITLKVFWKAPSTYVGLVLPGAGKAGGIAATQAAKQAVNRTLAQALKTPITTLASKAAANPVKTAVLVEGTAGTLQNVAAQKAEMAADLREDYDASETLLAFGLSGAPVGALGVLAKGRQ